MVDRIPADEGLEMARDHVRRRAWSGAVAAFAAADARRELAADDLERLAVAAFLIGRDELAIESMARAHDAYAATSATARASRCAFWLGVWHGERGDRAQANGWFVRGERMLTAAPTLSPERGLLLVPVALRLAAGGDFAGALARFDEAERIGERCGDDDLRTLARQGRGRALLHLGRADEAFDHLDEAMLTVTRSGVSPIVVGIVFCSVLDACREVSDVRRAKEWTSALAVWCDGQPDLVPFRGPCLVHRAEVLRHAGDWDSAMIDCERACGWLVGPPARPGLGAAFAQHGDLLRLRGRLDEAEEAYGQARANGASMQPGLALLHVARGRPDEAVRALEHELDIVADPVRRMRLLPAYVEAAVAARAPERAAAAAEEIARLAESLGTPFLGAVAERARAAAALAVGDATAALAFARGAAEAFAAIDLPYEAACAELLEARAYRALHDQVAAVRLLRSVRDVFARLGAAAALDEVAAIEGGARDPVHDLTSREAEVLRVVATGASNRAVANRLGISERTVERHLSSVFAKLGVRSRTEAAAFAFDHDLR
jgi:DNA-binding CsgD family transcriptional regulator/tetratricopeptide (TPR) repeat protein